MKTTTILILSFFVLGINSQFLRFLQSKKQKPNITRGDSNGRPPFNSNNHIDNVMPPDVPKRPPPFNSSDTKPKPSFNFSEFPPEKPDWHHHFNHTEFKPREYPHFNSSNFTDFNSSDRPPKRMHPDMREHPPFNISEDRPFNSSERPPKRIPKNILRILVILRFSSFTLIYFKLLNNPTGTNLKIQLRKDSV